MEAALRPREELLAYGSENLSLARLLALLIGSGSKQHSVESMARDIVQHFGGVAPLSRAKLSELSTLAGVGPALGARIVAAFQLGRLAASENSVSSKLVRGPSDLFGRLAPKIGHLQQECFWAVGLDCRGRVIGEVEVARGSVSEVMVHPREFFRPLVAMSAFACVAAHNHPSQDPTPSAADYELGQRLFRASALLGIELLDHMIITSQGFSSMADRFYEEPP